MKQAFSRSLVVLIVVLLFVGGIGIYYTRLAMYGPDWATYPANRHLYSQGKLVKAGVITDRNDVVLAKTEDGVRSFNSNKNIRMSTLHAVGDLEGFISTGMQSAYLSELCGYDRINGVYNTSGKGNNMQLTLDASVCTSALKALGNSAGTVGIYNYKTGEIVCMVSTPTYDPMADTKPTANGVYVNRFLSGVYTPGSIFKLVTTLSALENIKNAPELTFSCNHGVTLGGELLSCLGKHGNIRLDNALVYSCNAFFAQTALKLGRATMTKTAEKVGFNKKLKMDGITCTASKFAVKSANDIDFGWSGIGQYTDLVNPYQYMTFVGAIANDGIAVQPYLIKNIKNPAGLTLKRGKKSTSSLLSKTNAEIMAKMMRNNVIKNYGDSRFSGLEVCGKTGTAEVGDQSTPHSWFVGFCDNPDKPYAFSIIVENAGSGNGSATRIAATVLKTL